MDYIWNGLWIRTRIMIGIGISIGIEIWQEMRFIIRILIVIGNMKYDLDRD